MLGPVAQYTAEMRYQGQWSVSIPRFNYRRIRSLLRPYWQIVLAMGKKFGMHTEGLCDPVVEDELRGSGRLKIDCTN